VPDTRLHLLLQVAHWLGLKERHAGTLIAVTTAKMLSPTRLAAYIIAALMLQPALRANTPSFVSISRAHSTRLELADQRLRSSAVHDSRFAALSTSAVRNACQANSQPQALATPDPLLSFSVSESKITVSFIIGTDGRIQSPLILSSDNPAEDKDILQTVRSWRYRPALCNGVPTEAEARVEFSNQ